MKATKEVAVNPVGSGGVKRAHFARRRSGQLGRMIDGRRPRRGRGRAVRRKRGNRLGNRQRENPARQCRGMVVRSAAMVMPRSTPAMVAVGVRVRHAILMRRDFPVLVGMGGLRHAEHGQGAKPKDAEMTAAEHSSQTSPRFSEESSRLVDRDFPSKKSRPEGAIHLILNTRNTSGGRRYPSR